MSTGPTGPKGLTGAKGPTGTSNLFLDFDKKAVYVSSVAGSDVDFVVGDMNQPVQTIQKACDILLDGMSIIILPGTYNGFTMGDISDYKIHGICNPIVTTAVIFSPSIDAEGRERNIENITFVDNVSVDFVDSIKFENCTLSSLTVSNGSSVNVEDVQFTGASSTGYRINASGNSVLNIRTSTLNSDVTSVYELDQSKFIAQDNVINILNTPTNGVYDIIGFCETNTTNETIVISGTGLTSLTLVNDTLNTGSTIRNYNTSIVNNSDRNPNFEVSGVGYVNNVSVTNVNIFNGDTLTQYVNYNNDSTKVPVALQVNVETTLGIGAVANDKTGYISFTPLTNPRPFSISSNPFDGKTIYAYNNPAPGPAIVTSASGQTFTLSPTYTVPAGVAIMGAASTARFHFNKVDDTWYTLISTPSVL